VSVPEAANEPGGKASIDPALDQALRSPLARIIEAAEGIVDRADGPLRSDYATYAGDIAAAARHLLSVIRSMVDQPAEANSVIDLAALAGDALALVQPQADEGNVSLALRGEAAIPVHGDRRGVIQILVNLLGNSVRHSPEGGTVTLELRKSGAMAEASIADQGKGIAPEDQERIFEKFERLENGGGAGLGLAIARRLARSMGGEISLVSAPGEGACFTLSLPLASANARPRARSRGRSRRHRVDGRLCSGSEISFHCATVTVRASANKAVNMSVGKLIALRITPE
jgi:signal transduction histidine kinase